MSATSAQHATQLLLAGSLSCSEDSAGNSLAGGACGSVMAGSGGGASVSTGGGVVIGIGSGAGLGAAAFFLGFAFFTLRLAFFFAPFFALPFFGKQSHRPIVEVELVIKLARTSRGRLQSRVNRHRRKVARVSTDAHP
jgi:hypothetical protein